MSRMLLLLALAIAALPLAAALSLPPLGEFPPDWNCDEDRRVCAGAAAGGAASCRLAATVATCDWTYGWITRAWSDEAEPGTESYVYEARIDRCSSVSGCVIWHQEAAQFECAWLPVLSCEDDGSPDPGTFDAPLVMGECISVHISTRAAITARVGGFPPLLPAAPASVEFEATGLAGGATCLVDDGRD